MPLGLQVISACLVSTPLIPGGILLFSPVSLWLGPTITFIFSPLCVVVVVLLPSLVTLPPGVLLLPIPVMRWTLLLGSLFLLALLRLFGRILGRSASGALMRLRLFGRWCTAPRIHDRVKHLALGLRSSFSPIDEWDVRVVASEGDATLLSVTWRGLRCELFAAVSHGFCAPMLPARCTRRQTRVLASAGWGHPRRRCTRWWLLGRVRWSRSAISPLRTVAPISKGGRSGGNVCSWGGYGRSRRRTPILLWILSCVPPTRLRARARLMAPLIPLSVIGPCCLLVLPCFSTLSVIFMSFITGCILGNGCCATSERDRTSSGEKGTNHTTCYTPKPVSSPPSS